MFPTLDNATPRWDIRPFMARHSPKPIWDVERVAADMALRRWNERDLAHRAGVAAKTISRFLAGTVQTTKTAGKIADALGYSVRRYLHGVQAA